MITITSMTPADIDGKAYVHYQSWQETYKGLMDANYLASMTLEKCQSIARRFPDNILVAKDEDRVIGFAGYGAYRDETLPDTGEVYAIYVLAAYHGQGIGYRLMTAAMEQLSAYKRIALWVLRGNERAIRFYERVGFSFDGTVLPVVLGTPNEELRYLYHKHHNENGENNHDPA